MLSPVALPEIHENFSLLENPNIPSYSFLSKEEEKSIQEAIADMLSICEQIPSFQDIGYLKKKRTLILQGLEGLQQSKIDRAEHLLKICNPGREGRVLSKNRGIYKKNRDIFKEALVWELSVVLGCDQYIAPSMPLYIHDGEATFQPYFSVSSIGRFVQDGQEMPLAMRLEDYWTLALFTFLIGHSDLNGENLHFIKNGYLLLDNDCSFPELNTPTSINGSSLKIPLQNVFVDFKDSQKPLTGTSYSQVISTLNRWKNQEQELKKYFSISSLVKKIDSKASEQAFWERWEKLLHFPISSGITFRKFIQEIFPEHFKQIETAQWLASQALGFSVGPMTALHFVGAFLCYWPLEEKNLKEVHKWIQSNHFY